MAFGETKEFDLQRIQRKFNIQQSRIKNLPIDVEVLKQIYDDFQRCAHTSLEAIRAEILSELNNKLNGKVHSIRCRIKDADHLIEKIIRNIYENPDKYGHIDYSNYNKIITDLIGIRIIILDKRDWKGVHDSLLQIFRNIPERYVKQPEDIIKNYDYYQEEANKEHEELKNSYHAEEPVVYITSNDDRDAYKDDNLRIDNSKAHYRSIHYIIRYKTVYFEVQVRTLFEEGWLEFDHRIKYPYDQKNDKKQKFASILSGLAVAADQLISFYEEEDFEHEEISKRKEVIRQENVQELKEQCLEEKMTSLF